MRVAVLHSFYRNRYPSGENIAVQQQIDALQGAGIEILNVFRYTDHESERTGYRIKTAAQIASGHDFDDPLPAIEEFAPNLIHVHNLIPNFGTHWLNKTQIPVVTTLHNFRSACANGLLYRDGHVCLECPTNGSKAAVVHGCYQNSRLASIPLAIATRGGPAANALIKRSSMIITQSSRVNDFMLQQGISPGKLTLIPGFVEQWHRSATSPPTDPRFIFVGRDTPEKGLSELLAIWPCEYPLDVIGAEIRNDQTKSVEATNVMFLGAQDRTAVRTQLPNYSALVFPGRVWEGAYPLVIREAMEAGVPVIALEGSGGADLVHLSQAGATYSDDSALELNQAIQTVLANGSNFRSAARSFFSLELTVSAWIKRTFSVYQETRG